jgi:putative endonuclease
VPSDDELAVLPARVLVATHNQSLGRLGEDAAARWYEANGFTVVDRNWRGHAGELDLVAVSFVRRRPQIVAFVEVKTRSSTRFGSGVSAVGAAKQQRIRRLAGQWLSEQRARIDTVRFDIVDVDNRGHLKVYEAAF